jgi:peptidylprolyl isomerase
MRAGFVVVGGLLSLAAAPPKYIKPTDIVDAAPASVWRAIPDDDLLVIDMQSGGRVVIQLAPSFAPVHVANIKAFARSDHWSGAGVYRVQDNYVAQWGNADTEKPSPKGVNDKPPAEYWRPLKGLQVTPLGFPDSYAPAAGFSGGWPVAVNAKAGWASLTHCYGAVGVARGLAPDVGSGSELYTIIGTPPRQLDRNITIVGRVIEGIENLNTLQRGTEALGFYKDPKTYVPIAQVRIAADIPVAERPRFEYMDTSSPSFARYKAARGHRRDEFYETSALGADLCNVPVPVRKKS